MTAATGATGLRAWLATRKAAWLTPQRLRTATAFLVTAGVLAASVRVGA